MQPRVYVDFNYVEPEHAEIDERLKNWARWSYDRGGGGVSPMFRLYRATDAAQMYGAAAPRPVDAIDAQRVQKGVSALPSSHRLAISWCYIKRTNPRRAAQNLGESLQGLGRLIQAARQMLMNRGV